MRWVVITALGSLVEPEVNRNLARLSGRKAAKAWSAQGWATVASTSANGVLAQPASSPWPSTRLIEGSNTASMALP
ncbi:hypothetical protein D3C79_1033040 [compost metagenome]